MSHQHNNSDTLLTGYVVLLNLIDTGGILSIAGGIFLILSIVKVFMDIYYHPRRKGEERSTDQANDVYHKPGP